MTAKHLPLAFLISTAVCPAATIATRTSIDAIVGLRQSGGPALGYYSGATGASTNTTGGTGSSGSRFVQNLVYRYDLPTLSLGQTIDSFSFSFQITGLRDHSNDSYELDVYLLDLEDPTTTGSTLFVDSATDPDNAFVGSHFIDTGNNTDTINLTEPVDVTFTISSCHSGQGANLDKMPIKSPFSKHHREKPAFRKAAWPSFSPD